MQRSCWEDEAWVQGWSRWGFVHGEKHGICDMLVLSCFMWFHVVSMGW